MHGSLNKSELDRENSDFYNNKLVVPIKFLGQNGCLKLSLWENVYEPTAASVPAWLDRLRLVGLH